METTRDNSLDAGLLTSEEKQALHAAQLPPPAPNSPPRKKGLSPGLLVALIVTALLTLSVALGPRMTSCMRHHARPSDASFAQLLHSADPESLRQVLADRLPEKYGKGVFPSDKDAVEAVHGDDAELATKIVRLAARQDDNNSTTDEKTDEEPTSTEDDETSEEPTDATTTDKDDDDESSTTEKPSEPTESDDDDDKTTSDDNDSSTDDDDESKTSEDKTSKTTKSDGGVATITSYADGSEPTDKDSDDEDDDADLQDDGARPAVALLPVLGAAAGALLML